MSFNSFEFLIFIILFFFLYWKVFSKNYKLQNILVLIASYYFYGRWDWRFLSLLLLSTILDYFLALKIQNAKSNTAKKNLITISVFVNLGILFIFKYFNFFIDNAVLLSNSLGFNVNYTSLQIILPVGISFYTFQTLSYTLDVYKGNLKATNDIIAFASFVSFFPQLVAGPIERATNLLPQFEKERIFDYNEAMLGAKQILWGFFKKIVIADNCAQQANIVFGSGDELTGSAYLFGAMMFSFQIYGDFSGYSDIAIGLSRIFGVKLMNNFLYPYFSRDLAEFWRRWHISLSTWFRDYVYIPLGGNQSRKILTFRNVSIVFLVSALWHGANWTFVFWGLANAIFFLPLILTNKNRKYTKVVAEHKKIPTAKEFFSIIYTFILVSLMWIFFRAENLDQAFKMYSSIFSTSLFSSPHYQGIGYGLWLYVILILFVIVEWIGRRETFAIEENFFKKPQIQIVFFYLILFTILLYPGNEQRFIYFQF